MKSPIAVLEYMKQRVPTFEYECIKDCILKFDVKKQSIQLQQKRAASDSWVYNKSCAVVFTELQATLYEDYEFALSLQMLHTIAGVVQDEFAGQHHTVPGDCPKTWQGQIQDIRKSNILELQYGKEEIAQCNTHLRFAIAYNELDKIVALAEQEYACCSSQDTFDTLKNTRNIENMLDDSVTSNTVFSKLKNEVLLGAVIKLTQRLQTTRQREHQNIIVCGQPITSLHQMHTIEENLQKALQDVKQQKVDVGTKYDKLRKAQNTVEKDMCILQKEADRVAQMIHDIKNSIADSTV